MNILHLSIAQIIAAIGGVSVLMYILILMFVPGLLLVITPIITNLVMALAGLVRFLWKGFLFTAQSVPAMLLLVCIAVLAYAGGKEIGTVHTWHKVHETYTVKKKPKYRETDTDTNHIFKHPLDIFR